MKKTALLLDFSRQTPALAQLFDSFTYFSYYDTGKDNVLFVVVMCYNKGNNVNKNIDID